MHNRELRYHRLLRIKGRVPEVWKRRFLHQVPADRPRRPSDSRKAGRIQALEVAVALFLRLFSRETPRPFRDNL